MRNLSKIYVHQAIEKGLKDSQEGKTLSTDEVRARYELSKFFPHHSHHRYARYREVHVGEKAGKGFSTIKI